MRFEKLLENEKLWAVVYDGEDTNAFEKAFSQWNDYEWLEEFFSKNINDLSAYFHIVDVDKAIYDTVDDAYDLECLILDLDPECSLDKVFKPLENYRANEVILGREKTKGRITTHASWLRIYAIKLETGRYVITGGAIKLTATMQEREHTLKELQHLNQVRDFLKTQGISDYEGFKEISNESD